MLKGVKTMASDRNGDLTEAEMERVIEEATASGGGFGAVIDAILKLDVPRPPEPESDTESYPDLRC